MWKEEDGWSCYCYPTQITYGLEDRSPEETISYVTHCRNMLSPPPPLVAPSSLCWLQLNSSISSDFYQYPCFYSNAFDDDLGYNISFTGILGCVRQCERLGFGFFIEVQGSHFTPYCFCYVRKVGYRTGLFPESPITSYVSECPPVDYGPSPSQTFPSCSIPINSTSPSSFYAYGYAFSLDESTYFYPINSFVDCMKSCLFPFGFLTYEHYCYC